MTDLSTSRRDDDTAPAVGGRGETAELITRGGRSPGCEDDERDPDRAVALSRKR